MLYPHPGHWPALTVLACGALLAAVSAVALARLRSSPYLAVGWLWFLGMLVPVIGLVQVGEQAMADRYAYLPSIGLFVMATWGVSAILPSTPTSTRALAGLALTTLMLCAVVTRAQVAHWRDSRALWEHALAGDPTNAVALEKLGVLAIDERRFDDALMLLRRSVKLAQERETAQYNLGNLLMRMKRPRQAMGPLREAVRLRPDFGLALGSLGQVHHDLGDMRAAIGFYQLALQHQPNSPISHTNLGAVYQETGDGRKAVSHYREALRLSPGEPYALRQLAGLLASDDPALRDGAEAVRLAVLACEQSRYANPIDLDTLARAQAATGRYDRAAETAERAVAIARRGGAEPLAREIETRLSGYRAQVR